MLSLNRNEKGIYKNFGTEFTNNNRALHKKRYSVVTLNCTQCPNFSVKSHIHLKYHVAMMHSAPKLDVAFDLFLVTESFQTFTL